MSTADTLHVLKNASNEDLAPLVAYILEASTTENLTGRSAYKQHQPNHRLYVDDIFSEIRLFGGNSFVNLFRSEGPSYSEVVQDVAGKFGVKKADSFELVELEQELIRTIMRNALSKAEGQERLDIEAALKEAGVGQRDLSALMSGTSLLALLGARAAGLLSYQVATIVASTVARQVLGQSLRVVATGAASAALGRGVAALTGPVGWVLTGVWTAVDLAGPAFRVTAPCVLHIAMLRQRKIAEDLGALREAFADD
ncbi:ubiquinol-cytochrome C chaperone family protein [Pseudomonas soli]|uniref:ubiquinol-cytochrome C chaperone family protein n=1 Tax=Pseudomonas soli TaxID=1306993 RepID=UPI0028A59AAC|nr:ubiquinol-cytochrome C chaperone family protein [Pseudomonas soli]